MYEIRKEVTFDSAHYLRDYEGQCSQLHGHTWRVIVIFRGEVLDNIGMLKDFGDVKKSISRFDHKVLNTVSPFDHINPTAENLARVICNELGASEVHVWETPSSEAVYIHNNLRAELQEMAKDIPS